MHTRQLHLFIKKLASGPDIENSPRKMESAHVVLNTSSRKCSNRDNCRRLTAVRKKPWIKWDPNDATSTAHDHPRSGLVAKPICIGCLSWYYHYQTRWIRIVFSNVLTSTKIRHNKITLYNDKITHTTNRVWLDTSVNHQNIVKNQTKQASKQNTGITRRLSPDFVTFGRYK